MADFANTTFIDQVRAFLSTRQGREVDLTYIRNEMKIDPNSKAWMTLGKIMAEDLTNQKIVKPSGKRDGVYRVIVQVKPVQVFGIDRERRPPYDLIFPRDFDTLMEMAFADDVVIREGDLIVIGGVKSKGKTHFVLNMAGENIHRRPVLMGNEYTVRVVDKLTQEEVSEPAPRFLNRLDEMDVEHGGWIEWRDKEGKDRFLLLPVDADYAEHIVKDRINIIDYISLDADKLYDIGVVLREIKKNLGRGIAIAVLQKKEGNFDPRGGQFARDSADLELMLDGLGEQENEVLLTIRGCKEKLSPIVGKTYAYAIGGQGTKTLNFREMKKCPDCKGTGYKSSKPCEMCYTLKYIDK